MRVVLSLGMVLFAASASFSAELTPQDARSSQPAAALFDPDAWRFVGCETFKSDELRDALAADFEVLVATRSTASHDTLIETLVRQLTLGYRAAGFPQAHVTGDVDSTGKHLVLTIDEGRRSLQGQIEVRGAKTIPVERLAADVTRKFAPPDAVPVFEGIPREGDAPLKWLKPNGQPASLTAAVWTPGKPASYAPQTWKSWEPTVRLMLQRLGYHDPTFVLAVEQAQNGTATLVIDLRDEGPRTVLGEIEVIGTERNSPEDVIHYLQLQPGIPLDSARLAHLRWQLREAARFLKHDVELIAPPLDGPSRLKITLVEAPHVPKLTEDFSATEQAAIRAAKWMSTQTDLDWEATYHFQPSSEEELGVWKGLLTDRALAGRLILSPSQSGMLWEARLTDDGDTVWGQRLTLNHEKVCLEALHRAAKLEQTGPGTQVFGTMTIDTRMPDDEGRMSNLNFGVGVRHEDDAALNRSHVELNIAPLALLLEIHREGGHVQLADGLLTIQNKDMDLSFEANSGQLRHWRMRDNAQRFELHTGRDVFAKAVADEATSRATALGEKAASAPVTSLALYLSAEARCLAELQSLPMPKSCRLVERLVSTGALRPFDELISKSDEKSSSPTRFQIPIAAPDGSKMGPLAWLDPFLRAGLPHYSKVFPRHTPGWMAGREAVFLMLQPKGVSLASPFGLPSALHEAGAGPLHFLLAAQLYGYISLPHRLLLAQAGLQDSSFAAFRRDVRLLLDRRGILGQVGDAFVQWLRSANESDLEEMTRLLTLGEDQKDLLASLVREMSRRRDVPWEEVVLDQIEPLWESVLRPELEARLKQLAEPPQTAARPVPQPE